MRRLKSLNIRFGRRFELPNRALRVGDVGKQQRQSNNTQKPFRYRHPIIVPQFRKYCRKPSY